MAYLTESQVRAAARGLPIVFRVKLPFEPTDAQLQAGRYPKRRVEWKGLVLRIENEPGTFRRGRKPDGSEWETLMKFAYGEVERTEGVDGDPVDVFLGPYMDSASMVYVVHQRRVGDWDAYDEDKCMLGFDSEADAVAAFLSSYDDPRFLGPITAMPVEEFIAKAKATKEKPAMIKSVLVLAKSFVGAYVRGGRAVRGYDNKRQGHAEGGQGDLFAAKPEPRIALPTNPSAEAMPEGHSRKHYATVIRNAGTPHQKVGWLAGPFDTNEEAAGHVDAARRKASELDPASDFDAFGTSSRVAASHRPGVLNRHLGIPS